MFETTLVFFQSNAPVVSAAVAVCSSILAILAFVFSILSFRRTRAATLYSDIDARYLELLKLGITYPKFVNPALTTRYREHFQDDELLRYERYAFAAWNIVETIIDRRDIGNLGPTWDPIIKEENKLHRAWLNDEENQDKFKRDFWEFMAKNYRDFPCPNCDGDRRCARCTQLLEMIR